MKTLMRILATGELISLVIDKKYLKTCVLFATMKSKEYFTTIILEELGNG